MSVRQDREKLIVELYRKGGSYREISKMARISVRDIKPILQKYGADNLSEYADIDYGIEDTNAVLLPNSKAYKLFSEGKNPLEVSIALNLRAPEVRMLYKEFWKLRRMHSLAKLCNEIGDKGVSTLLQLHKSCTAQQISNDQVISYLTTFGNYLPAVQIQYQKFQNETYQLLSKKHQLETDLYGLNTTIGSSFDMLKSLQIRCEKVERERNSLAIQKLRLLRFVSESKNNNSMFMKIERFVEEKVNMILINNMKLLELSLISALKAFKDDPNAYRYLFQKSDFAATAELISRIPTTNSLAQFHKSNSSLVRVNKNPITYSHSHDNLQYHTQKQRPGDYCYACYSCDSERISRKYFDNLGKEMISDIGLDSFEGMCAASGTIRQQ
jgi:hypothetical protein